jgi:selenophosphate synthase
LARALEPELEALLFDPQTSGGLLISMEEDKAQQFVAAHPEASIIGRVRERGAKPLRVV